jgi:hypothetical protein
MLRYCWKSAALYVGAAKYAAGRKEERERAANRVVFIVGRRGNDRCSAIRAFGIG